MELGYARVSTTRQDLDRQIDALTAAGIPPGHVYVDKKSGATVDRPGLKALLDYCRGGEMIVVHTLDRLGRTVRDTLNLIHQLRERGVGVRNLADPIRVDSEYSASSALVGRRPRVAMIVSYSSRVSPSSAKGWGRSASAAARATVSTGSTGLTPPPPRPRRRRSRGRRTTGR